MVQPEGYLEQTANYLRDFNEAVAETPTAEELYDRMLALYPRRANPGALWGGSKTAEARAQLRVSGAPYEVA